MTEQTTPIRHMPTRIATRTLEDLRANLTALQPKPKVFHSAREMVEALREEILDAMSRGYSLTDIADLCSGQGARITPGTLATYLREGQTGKPRMAGQGARPTKRSPIRARAEKPAQNVAAGSALANGAPTVEGR